MFQKILIANRGEIACRVAHTARRLGIKTVAVFSEADRHAAHVQACDEAVFLGGSSAKDSYLRGELILQIAQQMGAQAIHPGYGFLSENDSFAQQCADVGLVFIGPPPSAIRAMGLKAQSKQLMAQAGVPLVPGYHEADQTDSLLQQHADRIGYPLLIKASAGGGGKGMRIVEHSDLFLENLHSCRREAHASFGNADVLLERYLQKPRHVEIQVFGDSHGNYVHLFERDCSVQRRHQKVLEEAPAPNLPDDMRQAMAQAAIAAARAVDYVGAGTVEFIVETANGNNQFYFMEMNTRLQVEHPVTEMITGLDLVEWQLRVAAGEPLPLQQADIKQRGHAIEARLCAEKPAQNFLPAIGTLKRLRFPTCARFDRAHYVRVDAGVREADEISPFYDSMIAKVIVHGDTREQALARLAQTLAHIELVGVDTNLMFLQDVLATQPFQTADLDTGLIQKNHNALFQVQTSLSPKVLALATALWLQARQASSSKQNQDAWQRLQGFRNSVPLIETFVFEQVLANGQLQSHTVGLHWLDAVQWRLEIAGQAWQFNYEQHADGMMLWLDEQRHTGRGWVSGHEVHVFAGRDSVCLRETSAFDSSSWQGDDAHTATNGLTATMPGKIVSWAVSSGQNVKAGEPMVVLEAMKMEHTLRVPFDGVVQELFYQSGEQIQEGVKLLEIQHSPQ
jgi:3-methylcrotonyl-CoA carboxylase alpha subunit